MMQKLSCPETPMFFLNIHMSYSKRAKPLQLQRRRRNPPCSPGNLGPFPLSPGISHKALQRSEASWHLGGPRNHMMWFILKDCVYVYVNVYMYVKICVHHQCTSTNYS